MRRGFCTFSAMPVFTLHTIRIMVVLFVGINFPVSKDDCEMLLNNVDHEYIVCFEFQCEKEDDSFDFEQGIPWFKRESVVQDIVIKVKQFAGFACANLNNDKVGFVVSSKSNDNPNIEIAANLVLYKMGIVKQNSFILPLPPPQPKILNVIATSVTLSWDIPSNCDNINGHIVKYRAVSDSLCQWMEVRVVGAGSQVIIDNLTLGNSYEFKVICDTIHGLSGESKVSDQVTILAAVANDAITKHVVPPRPVVPTGPVVPVVPTRPVVPTGPNVHTKFGKPTAFEIKHNSVCLGWSEPLENARAISCYSIHYRKYSEIRRQCSIVKTNGNVNWHKITKLESDTGYIFYIVAECDRGGTIESDESDIIETEGKKVSSEPGKPKAKKVSHNKIILVWEAPAVHPESVKTYIVYQGMKKILTVWSTTREVEIVGLTPNTSYIFSIAAQCEHGHTSREAVGDTITTTNAICSAPGKPIASQRAQDRIKIEWKAPTELPEMVLSYYVSYVIAGQANTWIRISTEDSTKEIAVHQLQPDTSYVFKIVGHCELGDSLESKQSDPIKTLPQVCGPPGRPEASEVTKNSITMNWSKPTDHGNLEITKYYVLYHILGSQKWEEIILDGKHETTTVTHLQPSTEYEFVVQALCSNGTKSQDSKRSIITKTRALKLADKIMPELQSHVITSASMGPKAQLVNFRFDKLLHLEWKDEGNGIAKFSYGNPNSRTFTQKIKAGATNVYNYVVGMPTNTKEEKVLLIVGATGAGKSTLINGMINYIFGVEFGDKYRLKLIHDESSQTQAHSQTSFISVYTFHWQEGFPFPYTLTIIDTPGFGDTRGLVRDQKIVSQIKGLFECSQGGIEVLHGIGFVIQASLARLTPTQQYIFDSILAVFGKDVKQNISILATFADAEDVQVMSAIEEAGVPLNNCFKFNNSALFSTKRTNMSSMFWQMGVQSYKEFFETFGLNQKVSLLLTKEVLRDREQIETVISGLQERLHLGLTKMEELNNKTKVLQAHEADIITNKKFTVTNDVPKVKRVSLDPNTYVTNCTLCSSTCHYPCILYKPEDKKGCAAMRPQRDSDAHCTVCVKKCHWNQHFHMDYRFTCVKEKVTETFEDLKRNYNIAQKGKNEVEAVIQAINGEMNNIFKRVVSDIQELNRCITRLSEIALKPNPLTDVQYIDILIESEKRQGKEGCTDRIKYLEVARDKAELLIKIASGKGQNISEEDLTFDVLSQWSKRK